MPTSTLVVLAHPDLAASRINAALATAVHGEQSVTVHDLYATYPDLAVDVAREKDLLVAHDRLVLQFPFYWYSAPPLLKKWLDEVFERGFAYGTGGTALHGKSLRLAISTGAAEDAYGPEGHNRFPVRDLLLPFDATAHLTGMRYEEPFLVHGARVLTDEELAVHADRYRSLLSTASPDADSSLAA
jgi:glutathione-regulated potassium-efflux system ancillary protein KefG